MFNGKRFLGFIPARGGSKGVPRKNIRSLAGRPLIAYSLEQAEKVPELDLTVVSTEDAEIKAIALNEGGTVIDRPPELALDTSSTEVAMLHALDVLEARGERFDYMVILEPTSPLRNPASVSTCIQTAATAAADVVITVTELRSSLGRLDGASYRPLFPNEPRRRQERQPVYEEAGIAYVVSTDHLRKTGRIMADTTPLAVVVSDLEAVDINTPLDFEYCQFLMEKAK